MTNVKYGGTTFVHYDSPEESQAESARILQVFERMEALGFEFEHGDSPDCVDYIIRPMLTDPNEAAEADRLYAEVTNSEVWEYEHHLMMMLYQRDYEAERGGQW